MSTAPQLTLWLFGGLADPDSNILRLLINSNGLSKTVETKLSRFTVSRNFPLLQDGSSNKTSLSDIIKHIMQSVQRVNNGTKAYAYRSGFEQRLYNIALVHNWYTESNATHTLRCYKGHIHALVASVFAIRTRNLMRAEIDDLIVYYAIDDPLLWVRNEAMVCFSDLNSVLGNKQYLLGDIPNILDATVVGYLSTILYLEHPDSAIRDILISQDRLCSYVKRFNKLYGGGIADQENSRLKKPKSTIDKEKSEEGASWPTVIAAGTFAAFAMGSYAYTKGLFRYH